MRNTTTMTMAIAAMALGAAAVAVQGQAQAPRGARGPAEHAKVTPINNLPNPYETVRNWGTLPDGRKWLGQRDSRGQGRQAHLGWRPLRGQLVRRQQG
jgi:hypothetical protein